MPTDSIPSPQNNSSSYRTPSLLMVFVILCSFVGLAALYAVWPTIMRALKSNPITGYEVTLYSHGTIMQQWHAIDFRPHSSGAFKIFFEDGTFMYVSGEVTIKSIK